MQLAPPGTTSDVETPKERIGIMMLLALIYFERGVGS